MFDDLQTEHASDIGEAKDRHETRRRLLTERGFSQSEMAF